MILDAGFLIALDRGESVAGAFLHRALTEQRELHTTEAVVGQVWRDGRRQARLAAFLASIRARVHPLDDGRPIGRLLALAGTADVVDAHLVVLGARLGEPILTGDPDDLSHLAQSMGPLAPPILSWPPR